MSADEAICELDRGSTMKIEWLNKDRTVAKLTRGWLFKRETLVERTRVWYADGIPNDWKYVNEAGCGLRLERRLDRARAKAIELESRTKAIELESKKPKARDAWYPVRRRRSIGSVLPVARVVK